MDDPEEKLAERVESYTDWEGELNEIVHLTRRGVSGREIIINILLSDEEDCNNKNIIFNRTYNHFGVNIGVKNQGRYCVVLNYASHLGNKTEIHTHPTCKF